MSVFAAIIGLIICVGGAYFFWEAARKNKQKKFTVPTILFAALAVLFIIYLILTAILLYGSSTR
jgi:uncharacterized membrane protein YidH (DUF202 family)